jgi:hypothetical protein
MLALPAAISSLWQWFRLRAEQKTMRAATEELDRLPDEVLGDIGVSHDNLMCAFRNRRHKAENLQGGDVRPYNG